MKPEGYWGFLVEQSITLTSIGKSLYEKSIQIILRRFTWPITCQYIGAICNWITRALGKDGGLVCKCFSSICSCYIECFQPGELREGNVHETFVFRTLWIGWQCRKSSMVIWVRSFVTLGNEWRALEIITLEREGEREKRYVLRGKMTLE